MRYWFDTEFIEDGKTIDLISIGIVSEDGRAHYMQSSDCDLTKASPWVRENVIPHLIDSRNAWETRKLIAEDIVEFVGEQPEFWAYYASYDWVALCQLYGTMMDLPKGWPKYCRDLKQLCDSKGNPKLPPQEGKLHHALDDARWVKAAWHHLQAAE